jgi:hypothetical protein
MAKKRESDLESLRDFDEYEGVLNSITNQLGKQDEIYKRINLNLKDSKALVSSIADKIEQSTDLEAKHKKQIEDAARAYKQSKKSVAEALLQYKKRDISQKEYNELILKARNNYKEIVSQIDTGNRSATKTVKTFQEAGKELDAFADAAEKSKKRLEGIENAVDHIGGSGVKGVHELGEVLKSAANGGKGLTNALSIAAGVLAGMAYNYGLIGNKIATIAGYDAQIAQLKGDVDVLNQQIDMGGFGGKNFVAAKAMAEFSGQVAQMGAAFQAASKTALFGKSLGGVGYGAAQLQMAGISAEKITEAMQAAADATGKMPTGKMAADMAIMAERTGQSTENIATISEIFQRLDRVSGKTALNLQEGVRAMADKAGVNLGSAMTEIAEASKEALSYQIKGSSQLAKQVIAAKSLGVSFNDVAKAGKNMVLNYKDSIKAEMSLSAMLGKNVNLSEVRARFMSGDQEGALSSLKSLGLNPKDMNMFQQQALQDALGGLDLNSIQKITENTTRSGGGLKEVEAGGANKGFLQTVQAREATLNATNAMISANTQVELTKLNTEEEVQRQNALIANVGGIADKYNNINQLEALKDAETGLTTAIIGLTAAMTMQGLGGLLTKKLPGGLSGMPNKFAGYKMTGSGPNAMLQRAGGGFASKAERAAFDQAKNIAKVGKVAKVLGPVATVAMAGLDYKNRKDEGQTTTQAAAGAGGGAAGGLIGMKAGAAAGGAIGALFGGVGAAPGALIGGLLGGIGGAIGGSKLADYFTGAGKKSEKPSVVQTKTGVTAAKPTVASVESQAKPIEKGSKPTVDAVNRVGQKQIVELNTQLTLLNKNQQNGYTELLRRTDITNTLLDTLIGATAEASAKPINISGKRVNDVMQNVKNRVYGITGA